MRRFAVIAVVLTFAFIACKKQAEPESTDVIENPPATEEGAQNAEGSGTAQEQAFLTFVTGLRRAPSEDRKVEDPQTGKSVRNWVTTLYRGEEATVLEVQGEWVKVRASDDSEGWIKKAGLLPTDGVSLATVFEKTKTFNRPDLLAQNTSRVIEPATLLFLLKTKDQFSEVNYYGQGTVWVLSDKLTTEGQEISAAKLLAKVQWLKSKKDPDADKVMELARSQFGDSKLVSMANEEGKVEEAAGEEPSAEGEDAEQPSESPTE